MHIERAGLKDLEQLSVLFEQYRQFYKMQADPDGARAFLQERITNKESVIFISLNEDNMITGFAQLYPLFSSTRMKRQWLLNDLFVHEHFRGKQISVGLIDACKALCADTGACGMFLETAIDNITGNKLYRKTGFQLISDCNFYSWENVQHDKK